MSEQEFGVFSVEVARKPVAGVTAGTIPPALAEMLEAKYKEAVDSADFELVINAAAEKDASKLALYARAWGAAHEPKLYVTKVRNTAGHPDNVARLNIRMDENVPETERPGRRKK